MTTITGKTLVEWGKHPRWVAVKDNFALGYRYSIEPCQRFGLDPDEMVSR